MGKMIALSCGRCGYKLEAPVGVGLGSFQPTVIGELLEGDERSEWKRLSDSQELVKCYGEQVIAYCTKCGRLHSIFLVTGQKKDGMEYIWGNKCPDCGSRLEVLRALYDIPCPSCKSTVLDFKETGLWD